MQFLHICLDCSHCKMFDYDSKGGFFCEIRKMMIPSSVISKPTDCFHFESMFKINKEKQMTSLTDKSMGVGRVKINEAKFFPDVPSYWKKHTMSIYHLLAKDADDYIHKYEHNGLLVIASVAIYDNKEWLHISFSRKSRIPSYDDIQRVRRDFIGEDKKCFMVFPKKENYVNIYKYCLHLWYSEDADIPDFEVDIPGIGKSI